MKSCPNCARLIEDDAAFCMYCGFNFRDAELICPSCGTAVPPEASFCPKCGCKLSQGQDSYAVEPEPVRKAVPNHRKLGSLTLKAGRYLHSDQLAPGTIYVSQDHVEWSPSMLGGLMSRKVNLYYPVIRNCGIVYCGKVPVLFFQESDGNQTGFGGIGGMREGFKFNFNQQREDLKRLALYIELFRREYLNWDYLPLNGFESSVFDVSSYSDEELLEYFNLI